MSERRHKQVVNIDEVAVREEARGGFGFRTRRLGMEAGGRAIGCSHFEIPPGKTSFPFHWHSAMEEAVYILEGTGSARIGDDTVAVRAGDYLAYPPGPATSHTITNTGTTPLRYLALSGNASPVTMDIVGYPDSKKIAYASGVDPQKGPRAGGWILGLHKEQSPCDYYLDEPIATKE